MGLLITVFTPSYNRSRLLPRLYDSLCRQTYRDFEWLIVDDGSTDETDAIVEAFQSDANAFFPIRILRKQNGGKHTAINLGVRESRGELFFIADSDDVLPYNSLEIVASEWKCIKTDHSFGGICGLDATFEGNIIGSGLSADKIDGSSIDVRFRLGVTGDMKEVFRTSVMREFPFPEIAGEKFCPEVLVWNRIATKYKLRYLNKVIYLAEYQQDGITSAITRSRMNSPVATMMTYSEMLGYDIPFLQKIKAAINYWRFRCCAGIKVSEIPEIKWYWQSVFPIGLLMHLRDKK